MASAILFLFKVIETKFLRETSSSEFSHSLGRSLQGRTNGKSAHVRQAAEGGSRSSISGISACGRPLRLDRIAADVKANSQSRSL
jgi:hypothetical protein